MNNDKQNFLQRLKKAKAHKQERLQELVKEMTERYEERTGLKVKNVEVW